MRVLKDLREEIWPVTRLAIPLAVAELGWAAMSIVDAMMVGRLPEAAVAIGAVSLGAAIFHTITISAGAILLGMDPLVSQAFGAGRITECHRYLWTGLLFGCGIIPFVMASNAGAAALLPGFGVNPAILSPTVSYLRILNWSTIPLVFYFAIRRYLQGRGIVKPVMAALLSANVVNVIGNWALIYGHLGAPALGTDGSAWSTLAARIYLCGILIAYTVWRERRENTGLFHDGLASSFSHVRRLFAVGLPAAAHVALEIAVFGGATALIARLDAQSLAAHEIALNAASLSFMVPLGISSAAAVRVGHHIGAVDIAGAARAGWTAIALGVGFMTSSAAAFLLFPERIARFYTPDPAVIQTATSLLAIAAAFQLFDGLQIVAAGALRGAGDTRTPMLCNLVFYWFVGLPAGYLLCFHAGWGAIGMWTGLCAALILIGSTLLFVWRARIAQSARLMMREAAAG